MGFGWNINEYLDPENNDIDELLFLILFFLLIEHSSLGRIDAEKLYCILMIAIIVLLFVDLKEELKEKSNIDRIASFKQYVVQKTGEIYKNKSLYKTKNTLTGAPKRNYSTTSIVFGRYKWGYFPIQKLKKVTWQYFLALVEMEFETIKFFSLLGRTLVEAGLAKSLEITNIRKKLYFVNFWLDVTITHYILTNLMILKQRSH